MARAAGFAQAKFAQINLVSPKFDLLLTPLGFGFAAFLARRIFPNSQGSGIPQVIAAMQINEKQIRASLVSLRVALGKIAVMTLGLLCGASISGEGPTAQVGAAFMFSLGRIAHTSREAPFWLERRQTPQQPSIHRLRESCLASRN